MNQYTILCTKKQIKKAFKLGASIKFERKFSIDWKEGKRIPYPDVERDEKGEPIPIPVTAEQMIGWLEDQGFNFEAARNYTALEHDDIGTIGIYEYSRKEAALIAIDAALNYLINSKK